MKRRGFTLAVLVILAIASPALAVSPEEAQAMLLRDEQNAAKRDLAAAKREIVQLLDQIAKQKQVIENLTVAIVRRDEEIVKQREQVADITDRLTHLRQAIAPEDVQGGDFDLRKTRWGMSMDQVRAVEDGAMIDLHADSIAYDVGEIVGLKTTVTYHFTEGRLTSALYESKAKHANPIDYMTDYGSWRSILATKYGEPGKAKDEFWANDTYKGEPDQWGMAIRVGHLVMSNQWATPKTEIVMLLKSKDLEPQLQIEYRSVILKELVQQKAEQDAKGNF